MPGRPSSSSSFRCSVFCSGSYAANPNTLSISWRVYSVFGNSSGCLAAGSTRCFASSGLLGGTDLMGRVSIRTSIAEYCRLYPQVQWLQQESLLAVANPAPFAHGLQLGKQCFRAQELVTFTVVAFLLGGLTFRCCKYTESAMPHHAR
jgi:hypothetical protein